MDSNILNHLADFISSTKIVVYYSDETEQQMEELFLDIFELFKISVRDSKMSTHEIVFNNGAMIKAHKLEEPHHGNRYHYAFILGDKAEIKKHMKFIKKEVIPLMSFGYEPMIFDENVHMIFNKSARNRRYDGKFKLF